MGDDKTYPKKGFIYHFTKKRPLDIWRQLFHKFVQEKFLTQKLVFNKREIKKWLWNAKYCNLLRRQVCICCTTMDRWMHLGVYCMWGLYMSV